MKYKNIVVISHRRSGTHLTMDSIRNNFPSYRIESRSHKFMTLDFITNHYKEAMISLDEFKKNIWDSPHIFFTHTSADVNRFYDNDPQKMAFINKLFDNSKLIYVHRDGRDVMTSLFYYGKKFMPEIADLSFSEFIRMKNNFDFSTYAGTLNRVEYWKYHVESWLNNNDVLHLCFEDYKSDFEGTINKIANFIEVSPPKKITTMTRKAPPKYLSSNKLYNRLNAIYLHRIAKKKYQPYFFRKGKSGDHKNHFNEKDYEFFFGITGELMKKLGHEE